MKVEQIIHFICHRDRAPSKRAAQKFFMSPHKFCVVVPCREEPCYVLHFSFLPSFFFGGNFLPSSSGCVRRISFSLYPHPAPSLSHQLNARRTRIHTHNGPLGLGSCMETYNKKKQTLKYAYAKRNLWVEMPVCSAFAFVPWWSSMPMPIGQVVKHTNGTVAPCKWEWKFVWRRKALKMDRVWMVFLEKNFVCWVRISIFCGNFEVIARYSRGMFWTFDLNHKIFKEIVLFGFLRKASSIENISTNKVYVEAFKKVLMFKT